MSRLGCLRRDQSRLRALLRIHERDTTDEVDQRCLRPPCVIEEACPDHPWVDREGSDA